jgi:hypothetical protein
VPHAAREAKQIKNEQQTNKKRAADDNMVSTNFHYSVAVKIWE